MRRNVKLLGMTVFTACALVLPLLAATPAQAQSYSISGTLTGTGGSGSAPDGGGGANSTASGVWTTVVGDTAATITAIITDSLGNTQYVPMNIQGMGNPQGTFSQSFSLPSGTYKYKFYMLTQNGKEVESVTQTYKVP